MQGQARTVCEEGEEMKLTFLERQRLIEAFEAWKAQAPEIKQATTPEMVIHYLIHAGALDNESVREIIESVKL